MNTYSRIVCIEPEGGIDFVASVIASLVGSRIGFFVSPLDKWCEFTVHYQNSHILENTVQYLEDSRGYEVL